MAAPDLRIRRRPRGALTASVASTRALVAASAPVEDPASVFKTAGLGGKRSDWQDEAWELFNLVGEYAAYVRWRARSCSRVKLVASEIDPETGQPTGTISEDNAEGRRVAEIVHAIAGGPLGQAELIERGVQILCVPGEHWVVVLITDGGERWLAVDRSEIKRSQRDPDTVMIDLPEGGQHEFSPANGDGMFRVWNPHARRASEADSPIRSNLDPLREIVRTTQKIRNADSSRMNNNGILIIPSEASLPSTDAPVSADKPGDTQPAPPQNRMTARTIQRMLVDVNEQGRKDPTSAAAVTPITITAPAEHADKIKHVTFAKDLAKIEIEKRNDAIGRLAMGVDMERDQMLGLGEVNHWNGRLLSDNDVQMYVKPMMKTICEAYDRNVVRGMLVKEGIDPSKYVVWFDASDITADPDLTDEAKDAHEKGALNSAALLRIYGLPEDAGYDFESEDGWRQWAQDKVSQNPALLPTLLPLLDKSVQAIDFPVPQALPSGGGQDGGDDDEPDDRAVTEPDTEDQQEQSAAARGAGGIGLALELMYERAMDLAGKRRIQSGDGAQKARLRNVAPRDYHRYLPPLAASEVSSKIRGWDNGLDELAARYGFDPEALRIVVVERARKQLTAAVVDA